jgi:SHS2 domain-containing protein
VRYRYVEHVGEVELRLEAASEPEIFGAALVFLAEVEEFVPERVASFTLADGCLRATVEGRRGHPRHLVKAVTLNKLELGQPEGGRWHGRVVLDV